MALTVTTDLTVIATAETLTGWSNYGAGGTGTEALEPDFFVQGSNCISRGVSGAVIKGMCFDIGAGGAIDFNSGAHIDKLIYIWMKTSTPGLCETRANGGIRVVLGSGATAPGDAAGIWSAWYVDGSDSIIATEGWICYVIDPQSTPSTTYGGGVDLNSVRWFGGVQRSTTTAKGQNFGIDQISYGRGEIYVSGTVATAGAGFKEIADVVYDSAKTNRWGIITVKQGIYFVKGKIIIGHATANTTFSSNNETVVWETPGYYNGTSVVKAIPDASVNATAGADGITTYNGLAFKGGSGTTAIDCGIIAGTDSGRSGSLFNCVSNAGLTTPARTKAWIAASSDAMALSLYASTFIGFTGGIDLYGTNLNGDDCFACTFSACGQVDSNMEMKNCNFLDFTITTGAFLWRDSVSDITKSNFLNNARSIQHTSAAASPYSYNALSFNGNTYDVNNTSGSAIEVGKTNGANPTTYTGSTVTFTGSVQLTMTVKNEAGTVIVGAYAYIDDNDQTPYIMNTTTNSSGIATTAYTGSPVTGSRWRVRKYGYKDYKQLIDIAGDNISLPITLISDKQQT